MTNGDWLRQQDNETLADLIVFGEVYSRALSVVNDNDNDNDSEKENEIIVKQMITDWLNAEKED